MVKIQWLREVWRILFRFVSEMGGCKVSVSYEMNLEVVGGVLVTAVPDGKSTSRSHLKKSWLVKAAKMQKPASGAHVPACMHTDGWMLGSRRMEHVVSSRWWFSHPRPETSLSMFLDVETECKAVLSSLKLSVLKHNTVFHFSFCD